jgi:sodium/potassium-transporting ATPase subunit alpha
VVPSVLDAAAIDAYNLLTAGIVSELALILLIDDTDIGDTLFGTASIPLAAWIVVLPFAVVMFVLEEIRKGCARKFS